MKENNRGQEQNQNNSNQGSQSPGRQSQNVSDPIEQNSNPQNGGSWNNYRTRELSEEGSGEGKATTPRGDQ